MMALNLAQAGKDLSGAIDLLQQRSGSKKVGVVGYCMGGGARAGRRRRNVPMPSSRARRTTA